jgi:uncharacterized protein (TIGR01777 family)
MGKIEPFAWDLVPDPERRFFMRVIITGGAGFIGKALAAELVKGKYDVVLLSRNPERLSALPERVSAARWDGKTAQGWGELADGAFAIVNLAGESLLGSSLFSIRWTKERREGLLLSRVNAGKAVVEAVQAAKVKPQVVLQVVGVGYYGARESQPVFEDEPPGTDYLAQMCIQWDAATQPVEALGVRRVVTRLGVVLARDGGSLPLQSLPFKLFVGGPVGSGKQGFAWIHLTDAVRAMRFLIENPQAQGVFNLTAPELVTNAQFGKVLGRAMRRPYYFPVPAFALRLAFGEAATVLLDGQMPDPKRLREMGYRFQFPDLASALGEIYRKQK